MDGFSWANAALMERIEKDPRGLLKDRGLSMTDDVPLNIVHEVIRMVHLLWVNGKVIPIDQFYIDPSDEGLLFGRGVWESTRTVQGRPWLWSLHVDRIFKSAQVLGIQVKQEEIPTIEQVVEYVKSCTSQDVLVRLNISAGRPGHKGLIWMSLFPQSVMPVGIRLKSIQNPVQKGQPYLTLKTFQYATRLRMGQQVAAEGFDTALMLDDQRNIMESSHANIFMKLPTGWVTPKNDGGFLPGTVRALILGNSPIPVQEQVVPYDALNQTTEIFLTNSNTGIVPVTQVDNFRFQVGDDTRRLMQWLTPPASGQPQYRFVEKQATVR